MSAEAMLAGLYEPNQYQTWNPDLLWFPIPVHTTESTLDPVFLNENFHSFHSILFQKLCHLNSHLAIHVRR